MRILHLISLLSFLLLPTFNFAQESEEKSITLAEAQVFIGGHISSFQSLTLDEMKKFAPNSSILSKDYTGFGQSGYPYLNNHRSLKVSLGLSFKKLPSATLRLGINYANRDLFYGSLWKSETHPYDTLTSSQNGQQYFVDSSRIYSTYFMQSSDNLGIDASLIFRTKPEARWSLFGGIGYGLAVGINSQTMINYNDLSQINNPYYYQNETVAYESENFKNKTFFSQSLFLPMGVDFRIGKKREFWNRLHLFYEINPSITFNHIPEFGTSTHLGIGHGLGIRVKW